MNALLMQNRPLDGDVQIDKTKWEETWNNSAHVLEPLAKTLKAMQAGLTTISPTDFDCPNHYAKLVYEQTKKQVLQDILDLLPDAAKVD